MINTTNYKFKSWSEYFISKNGIYDISIETLPIDISWNEFIKSQKGKKYWVLIDKLLSKIINTDISIQIYPYPELVFNAINSVKLNDIKVFILGQDPYFNYELHNNQIIPQSMGISFSVPVGIKIPSSLINIHKNLLNNGLINKIPDHGNLNSWINQGVMLFNAALTVQHGIPNSHAKYWKEFSNELIKYVSNNTQNIVFILWGKFALNKLEDGLIDDNKHCVIVSSHPSGLSNTKEVNSKILNKKYPSFNNSNSFKECNDYLLLHNKTPINWNY
jgi:uracil-DNA glycosylase